MSEIQSPERIAYVLDDEPGVRFVVCHILKSNGFDATAFSDAEVFLKAVQDRPPETVIVDLALGNSDAVEIIRQLDEIKYRGKMMLFSGRDEATLREISDIGKSHGIAMLPPLRKPFRAAGLQKCIFADAEIGTPVPEKTPEVIPECTLAEALANGWLELWYQPKIDLKSGLISGAEGLIRARHPKRGIIPPVGFLPPSSDPLHEQLAHFVVQRAMADWTQFAEAGLRIKLAINIPVSVLRTPGFVGLVREALPHAPKFPGLIVEVVEDEAMMDGDLINEIAAQLKLNNVVLSIDDFGAADSSLSRLLDLSCAEVKLDRGFITGCSSDDIKHAMCCTVVDLAHKCGVSVCAEGIETPEDLHALVDMGCDTGQGYLFAKPMELAVLLGQINDLAARTKAEMLPRARELSKMRSS